MNSADNPFRPPEAEIEPVHAPASSTGLLDAPRAVATDRGLKWIGEGWELFKLSPWLWIGMLVVSGLCFIVAGMLPIVGMLSSWLFPMFLGGWMIGCQRLKDTGELRFEDLFAGFSQHFKPLGIASLIYLGASVVVTIVAIVIAAILGGGVALLMGGDNPSLFMLAITLGVLVAMALLVPVLMMILFAPALIVLHDVAPVEALKMSFHGCLRNIMPFLIYGLVGLLMLVVGAIPIFLGWLVVYPVLMIAIYTSYRDIFLEEDAA